MAKINGVIIPKASGSIGNITFRTAKRETVASEKITSNKSNTPAQAAQRATFRQRQVIAQIFRPIAKMAFKRNGWKTAYSKLSSAVMLAEDITSYAGIVTSASNLETGKVFNLADGEVNVTEVDYHKTAENKCSLIIYGTVPEDIENWDFDIDPENVDVRGCVMNNPLAAVPYPDFAEAVEVVALEQISSTRFGLKLVTTSFTEVPTYETPQEGTYSDLLNIPVPFVSIAGQWLKITPWTPVSAS